VKGEMDLKFWEKNVEENKKLAKEENEDFMETLSSVESNLVEFEENNISEELGYIEVEMNKENSPKNKENIQYDIQQMNQTNLIKINELLVKPNLQFQITAQQVKKIQENLPLVQKKMFAFELNEKIEPLRFVVALMDMCTQFNEKRKASASRRK
jgi:hypothetical protein